MAQSHVRNCVAPSQTTAIPRAGGGANQDDNTQGSPQPTAEMDQEAHQSPAAQVEWGEDTIQDSQMLSYGFFINKKWRLVICQTCCSGVAADRLNAHLSQDLKQLGLYVPCGYCTSLIKQYSLLSRSKLRPPTSVIPAIYGLPIKPNMKYCSNCGYAAVVHASVVRHQQSGCQGFKVLDGPAQTFFPTTNQDYFAVEVPDTNQPNLDDPTLVSTLFKAQFFPEPASDPLITIPSNIHDINHFLTLGNWFEEVEGLTGKEAYHITRNSLPKLHELIWKSVDLYVKERNKELKKESDHAVKTAMGDYNKWVPCRMQVLN